MQLRPLSRAFFNRDPRVVARALLGKVLVRGSGLGLRAARIVETEAYLGRGDRAAHAAAGPTARNAVLFGPPGHAYVYLNYGLHYCLNVSCLPPGVAGCVLLRALQPLAGAHAMARARGLRLSDAGRGSLPISWGRLLASGPARLCQAFAVSRDRDNGSDLRRSTARGLWIAKDGFRAGRIITSARIGITKSAHLPLRYFLAGNSCVSSSRSPHSRAGEKRNRGN